MKSEKGITLISLIVYVIVMLVVVTIIGTATNYFYSNVNNEYTENKDSYNESTLDMYLVNDLKNREIYLTDINENEILMDTEETVELTTLKVSYKDYSNVIYKITEEGIYRNSVKIFTKDNSYDMKFRITNIETEQANSKKKIELIKTENMIENILKTYVVTTK